MFVCCGMMGSDRVSTNVRSTLVCVRVNPYQQTYQVICEQVQCRTCTGNKYCYVGSSRFILLVVSLISTYAWKQDSIDDVSTR